MGFSNKISGWLVFVLLLLLLLLVLFKVELRVSPDVFVEIALLALGSMSHFNSICSS